MNADQGPADPGVRRAAVILSALGPAMAEKVGSALDAAQRHVLEAGQRSLSEMPAAERKSLLESFATACRRPPRAASRPTPAAPVPAARPAARPNTPRKAVGEDTRRLPCLGSPGQVFEFLDRLDPGDVAEFLSHEPPAIVALIVTHAPARASQRVLAALPRALSRDVALAIPDLTRPAPGVLRRLSDALCDEMRLRAEEEGRRREGVCAVARVLAACQEESAEELLGTLARRDRELSEAVARELERMRAPAQPERAVSTRREPPATAAPPGPRPAGPSAEVVAERMRELRRGSPQWRLSAAAESRG